MFSPKRNDKRSAEEAIAAPSDDTKQTAAQSLANLGGEDVADLMDAEVAGDAAAASTPMKKAKTSKAVGDEEEEEATKDTRRSTGGAAVSAAVAGGGGGEQEAAAIAIKEEVSTALPESTTPRRVAGANVLASLGGSGTNAAAAAGQAKMEGIPTLPPIVDVATAEGMAAQHDYLLQNLVHVST